MVFINDLYSSVTTPVKELKVFKRINLQPGEKKTVELVITPYQLALYNINMKKAVEFEVIAGLNKIRKKFHVQ